MRDNGMEKNHEVIIEAKNREIEGLYAELGEAKALAKKRKEKVKALEDENRRIKLKAPKEGDPPPPILKPKTNGGRVRAMSNAEFALWLSDLRGKSAADWLDWLEGNAQ